MTNARLNLISQIVSENKEESWVPASTIDIDVMHWEIKDDEITIQLLSNGHIIDEIEGFEAIEFINTLKENGVTV